MKEKVLVLVAILAILLSTANADDGSATFYTTYNRKYLSIHEHEILYIIMFISSKSQTQYTALSVIFLFVCFAASACLGSDTPTALIAAASPEIWGNGNACGTHYRIKCTDGTNEGTPHPCNGQTVEVEIVDFCPGCRGTFDLSQDAFAAIADTDAGLILIEYDQ